jgi:hypothetical protein
VKPNLIAFLWVVGLLLVFVAGGAFLKQRLPALQQHSSAPTRAADYVGDWQSETVSLDLHIESQGDLLQVSGLDVEPLVFERASPQAPYQQRGGTRQLVRQWKRLQLRQGDGSLLELRLREPQ